jgi:serine/threonine protein kinase
METDSHVASTHALMQASPLRLRGRVVGGYRLTRPLAHWPGGAVYLGARVARDTSSAKSAVVKVFGLTRIAQPWERANAAARFLREAAIVQRLSHPHILRVLAVGLVRGMPYMVFPFISGGSLATALCGGPLSLPETARSLSVMASALDYTHDAGILHEDVKPAHVLLDAEGARYLTDFGMARLTRTASGATWPAGVVIGTPAYMAPEQAQGAVVGPAADIFSLSVALYQMVTGVLPFTGQSPVETLLSVLRDTPTNPRSPRPDLPAPAEAALLKGLAKRPENRFSSCRAIADAFALGLEREGSL